MINKNKNTSLSYAKSQILHIILEVGQSEIDIAIKNKLTEALQDFYYSLEEILLDTEEPIFYLHTYSEQLDARDSQFCKKYHALRAAEIFNLLAPIAKEINDVVNATSIDLEHYIQNFYKKNTKLISFKNKLKDINDDISELSKQNEPSQLINQVSSHAFKQNDANKMMLSLKSHTNNYLAHLNKVMLRKFFEQKLNASDYQKLGIPANIKKAQYRDIITALKIYSVNQTFLNSNHEINFSPDLKVVVKKVLCIEAALLKNNPSDFIAHLNNNKALLVQHRDSSFTRFCAAIVQVMTLAIPAKLSKGSFAFWKSHGEIFMEKINKSHKAISANKLKN